MTSEEKQEPEMLSRFNGEDGRRKLTTALLDQAIVNGDNNIAKMIAEKAELVEVKAGVEIITQDGFDSDIFFIVSGSVSVLVNDREIARRTSGQHIGEMALIDPTAKRSASVKANEPTVLAKLNEPLFSSIADRHPKLWRRIAVELANRIRQRAKFHRQPNEKPMVFIASSSETLSVAKKIQTAIADDEVIVNIWTDGVFEASATTIESLISVTETYDFGVVIFGCDDAVASRGVDKAAPRDNSVFELGLMMGAIGRKRTIIVKLKDTDIKIPSDLLGVTCLNVDLSSKQATEHSISIAAKALVKRISSLGSR